MKKNFGLCLCLLAINFFVQGVKSGRPFLLLHKYKPVNHSSNTFTALAMFNLNDENFKEWREYESYLRNKQDQLMSRMQEKSAESNNNQGSRKRTQSFSSLDSFIP